MTPENFAYWLQGLLELQPDLKTLSPEQVAMIRQHLGYVFSKPQPVRPGYQTFIGGAAGGAGSGTLPVASSIC